MDKISYFVNWNESHCDG